MLGIIGGTSLLFSRLPDLEKKVISTPYGNSEVLCGEIAVLLRHQHNRPPHRINFRSNMAALALLGVDRVIAIGSAGSLKMDIPPGSLVIPTDYMSDAAIPSIHDHAIRHIQPGLPLDMAGKLSDLVPEARLGGVYVQTRGPRIETVAEVAALARCADIVGMTLASEATLALELGMKFAAICPVDNYANGLGDEGLSYELMLENANRYKDRMDRILRDIVAGLS
ncbi:5'-methylthioadenosine phosphorylase [Methanolinea mesophila]|uniref:MTAP family purine nucleoside phosphorylase n=1 Tax=Methanolinea mesophila TaxID=547055 RepID=UPI001AE57E7C|nr:MTAP family purine nucleoside phosphorylase [Methanolinea mesophila]MBP1928122.1 5'-methylthioadenosine phosphorylase [Methanolinea mesophila]